MTEITDKLWIQDIEILARKDRYMEVLPTQDMSRHEKLNALMRLALLIGLISAVVLANYVYLYVPIIMALIQIGAYQLDKGNSSSNSNNVNTNNNESGNESGNGQGNETGNETENESRNGNEAGNGNSVELEEFRQQYGNGDERSRQIGSSPVCSKPTPQNPFMNAMNYDSRYRQPACTSYDNEELQDKIEDYFDDNLFKDVSDIYNKRHSQRQFFTMPYTTFPNDQGGFAKWLYQEPETCKEGNGFQCIADNYERLQGGSYKLV